MLKNLTQNLSKLALGKNSSTISATNNGTETSCQPKHIVDVPFEKATFGMGCFWSCDSLYGAQKGVLRTRVGYAGGSTPNPSYRNLKDHTEVIEIDYDPEAVTYEKILNLFWNNHEYGLTRKQKRQYASLIFYHNDKQKQIAEESREKEIIARKPEVIYTEIIKADKFYPAEDYHQKYRLQGHRDLAKQLGLNSTLLQSSYVAAKLNGYLVGVGGPEQFMEEANDLGLTKKQIDYVYRYVVENEGGLTC